MQNKVVIETPEQVSELLKALTGIDIYQQSRQRNIIEHRALLCHILRLKLDMRWESISRFIESKGKNYDHATAIHAVKMYPVYKKGRFNYFEKLESNFLVKDSTEYNYLSKVEVLEKQYKTLEKEYLKALEKIRCFDYDFSGYTKTELDYRKLNKNQKEIFDERAGIIIKSFDWVEVKDDYEIINCET